MNAVPSVYLRSWEDRFGARLLQLGNDTMTVIAARVPPSVEEARRLIEEQCTFCPEGTAASAADEEDMRESTESLLDSPI